MTGSNTRQPGLPGGFTRVLGLGGLGCLFLLALSACERQTAAPPPLPEPPVVADPAMGPTTVGVWLHGIGILDNSLGEARLLEEAIQVLLDRPDKDSLDAARLAWHRSHDAYAEFELFTTLSESNPGLFGSLPDYDFAIEAWPIQPGYLDYFDVYTHSGIVNDIAMPLTAEALRRQHGFTDPSDVSLGFHALEYLLWGEEGRRPASDYQEASLQPGQQSAGVRPVDLPNNRRRVLIALLVRLLADDVKTLKQAVENPNGLLRRGYSALQPASRLAVLQGAGHLLLNRHRNQLQAQLESQLDNAPAAGEGPEAVDHSETLRHNQFAGGSPRPLAHSLQTVEQVLLSTEEGLGRWLLENESLRASAAEQLAQLRTALVEWNEEPWPPREEQGGAMVETLSDVSELLAPQFYDLNAEQ